MRNQNCHETYRCSLKSSLPAVDVSQQNEMKILGVNWDLNEDKISVKPHVASKSESITKRKIVQNLAKTYDPYGLLLPIMLHGKLLLQNVWKLGVTWDQTLSNEFLEVWNKYLDELAKVDLNIKRPISQYENPTLHIFADASTRCFGVVAYLSEGDKTDFVIAKSRLAPTKPPTLPPPPPLWTA